MCSKELFWWKSKIKSFLNFSNKDDPSSKSVIIEEVKELVEEEDHYENTPDKNLMLRYITIMTS
jgi:hypothetical protein